MLRDFFFEAEELFKISHLRKAPLSDKARTIMNHLPHLRVNQRRPPLFNGNHSCEVFSCIFDRM